MTDGQNQELSKRIETTTEQLRSQIARGENATASAAQSMDAKVSGMSAALSALQEAGGLLQEMARVNAGFDDFTQKAVAKKTGTQTVEDQAKEVDAILARLYPDRALTQTYEAEKAKLQAMMAIELDPKKVAEYTAALAKLEKQYRYTQEQTTLWGKATDKAVVLVDGVFADMWKKGRFDFEDYSDQLKAGFKDLLAELAHEAITKPIIITVANAVLGTNKPGDLKDVWGGLISGGEGSGTSGLGNLVTLGKNLYSIYDALTGVGSSIMSGYASGGISGALSGAGSYYGGLASQAIETITGWFSGSAAAGTGTATATASASTAAAGTMSSMAAMWPVAVIMGMYQSGKLYDEGVRYRTSDALNNTAAQSLYLTDPALGMTYATMAVSMGLTDKVLSKLVGGKAAAVITGSALASSVISGLNSALFGGAWKTKDYGFALGISSGDLTAQTYQDQKKKGGLFTSSKSRTKYRDLDPEQLEVFQGAYDEVETSVTDLFDALNVKFEEGTLAGLTIARAKINTKGKTDEEVQQAIADWFTGVGDTMTTYLSDQGNTGLGTGLTLSRLSELVSALQVSNQSLELINQTLFEVSPAGAQAADALVQLAGGTDALSASTMAYYKAFVPTAERGEDTLATLRKQFQELKLGLPDSREAFAQLVSSLDLNDEAARKTFVSLMELSGAMDDYYTQNETLLTSYLQAFKPADLAARNISDLRNQFQTLGQVMPETRDGFRAMVEGIDLTTQSGQDLQRALYAIAPAMNDYLGSIESQAAALSNARTSADQSVQNTIGDLRGSIFMDMLGNDGAKYDYAKAQAETLANLLPSLSSVTDITDVVNRITQLTSSAYGLLDDQGKQTNGREMIEFLDDIQAQAQERIAQSQEELNEQQALVLEGAINRATDRMATEMSLVIQQGNTGQADLRAVLGSITDQLSNALRSFGRTGREANG